jgi:hypothetical protein
MQTLVSVVTLRERKMLSALIAAGTEVPTSSVMGEPSCRRTGSTYTINVKSTEQDKSVSLPARGRKP